jgi:hypothetical protein
MPWPFGQGVWKGFLQTLALPPGLERQYSALAIGQGKYGDLPGRHGRPFTN